MTSVFSWQTLLAFALLHSVLQGQICLYSRCFLTSYFCIPVTYNEKDIFFGDSSRRSCRSSKNLSTSASLALLVRAWTWITLLNGLPCKRTEIILSFLRLHPSTAFHTFLLTMRATHKMHVRAKVCLMSY